MKRFLFLIAYLVLLMNSLPADIYRDQHYEYKNMESLFETATEVNNIGYDAVTQKLKLSESALSGYIVLAVDTSAVPFNIGLPSWNGYADRSGNSSFAIQMRFPTGESWSPWVTVGFWKDFIWSNYGKTSWSGGKVNIDIVNLYDYQESWQFKIIMKRKTQEAPLPSIHKLSFFLSDSRATDNFSIIDALNDSPEAMFIETDFLYQYAIDDAIGGSICSPTSVAMIIKSYGIDIDPLYFARQNKDPYYGIFGVWPRVVQNAVDYGLDGAVTRYRSWSDARKVLAKGGRIAISVGYPLYAGHLMMLAGFDETGNPIIHDPAQSQGYGYIFDKTEISRSWFEKGGIAYTFFLQDSSTNQVTTKDGPLYSRPHNWVWNFPNPFNCETTINYIVKKQGRATLDIYDLTGAQVFSKSFGQLEPGNYHYNIQFDNHETSGIYILKYSIDNQIYTNQMLYLK